MMEKAVGEGLLSTIFRLPQLRHQLQVFSISPHYIALTLGCHTGPMTVLEPVEQVQGNQDNTACAELSLIRQQLDDLTWKVAENATQRLGRWQAWISRPAFLPSAENLAAYLALRSHDVRELQANLLTWGVSTLGRCEPYVLPNLRAVQGALGALAGEATLPNRAAFTMLDSRLDANTRELFGEAPTPGIMVTFPSEAATQPDLIRDLLEAGMTCARINLAHDGPEAWAQMLAHLRAAQQLTGKSCRVLMDLAGPKVRTGEVVFPDKASERLKVGDRLALAADVSALPTDRAGVTCTLPAALEQVQVGQAVWIDDGKLGCMVDSREAGYLNLRVTHTPSKGAKLKPEKGINFPDTALDLPALTEKDRQDVHFAAQHADMVGYSFVQTVQDVRDLLAALQESGAPARLGIVLKIETKLAVSNVADLMVCAAGARPCGVMIARGDLAVELGFARLTEIQEEVMWLAEAAHIPVVWATQVLEGLVKKGEAKRGEYTDAASGVRAEVIMLNKGPFVVTGVRELAGIIARIKPHFNKKRP